MFTSLGVLALVFSSLNIPALVYSIRDLRCKESIPNHTSLFRTANYGLILWAALLAAGTILNRNYPYTPWLAPITILCVLIPIWWLIEFGRRGLKRPAPLYEWKTLTIGLTLAPVTILIIETLLVILVAVVVIILLGFQTDMLSNLVNLAPSLELSSGGMEQLDQILYDLAQNPTILFALYLVIGLLAPFTEELFKPLAVWLSWKRPMDAREGFILGLISGGAFHLIGKRQPGQPNQRTRLVVRRDPAFLHRIATHWLEWICRLWNCQSPQQKTLGSFAPDPFRRDRFARFMELHGNIEWFFYYRTTHVG